MKRTWIQMGMPIKVEIADKSVAKKDFDVLYNYFKYIDGKFSTYKNTSEISRINRGEKFNLSLDMRTVLELCRQTKEFTKGFFDIEGNGT
ncbi:MAG: FAD:protein FMN transferase, partial [Candidatus Paceibacterales bacterium]